MGDIGDINDKVCHQHQTMTTDILSPTKSLVTKSKTLFQGSYLILIILMHQ